MFTSWITQSYLKQLTPINTNVDVSEVASHIETCQIIHTREILGKNLYDDLNTKFINNTLNTIETELFEIIKQSIAYRSSEIAIPFLHIKIRNKGVVKLRDEYAEPASLEDMKYLRHELKNRAEYFEKEFKSFYVNSQQTFHFTHRIQIHTIKYILIIMNLMIVMSI